ncbi:hypothetical protein ACPDHL_05085 [Myroides sp. C15-4]|uniref:hypothetical protein n=1 Tax=Myroides sp. C15-4 TaxID=3400532 RepID=UPI003D2F7312
MHSFDDFEISFSSEHEIFGLCDNENNEEYAYLDEENGENWIATVHNVHQEEVFFYPIDHCGLIPPLPNGQDAKQCDGLLNYGDSIAFVELKSRSDHESRKWINEAEEQLKVTIAYFMQFGFIAERRNKNAYIVNKQRPRAHRSQVERAGRFEKETGFLLRIKANISTDERFSRETRR